MPTFLMEPLDREKYPDNKFFYGWTHEWKPVDGYEEHPNYHAKNCKHEYTETFTVSEWEGWSGDLYKVTYCKVCLVNVHCDLTWTH